MIRRFEVRCVLSEIQYYQIIEHVEKQPSQDDWMTNDFIQCGFNEVSVKQSKFDLIKVSRGEIGRLGSKAERRLIRCTRYYITIEVNPYRLIHGRFDLGKVYDDQDIMPLVEQFDHVIQTVLSVKLAPLHQWSVQWIEYAIDAPIETGQNSIKVDQYLQLIRQGNVPWHYTIRDTKSMGYCLFNQNTEIQFCELHLLMSKWSNASPMRLAEVADVLRVGVTFHRGLLTRVARRHGYKNTLEYFMIPSVFLQMIDRVLRPIVTNGDYFSVRKAAAHLAYRCGSDKRVHDGCRDMMKAVEMVNGLRQAARRWKMGKSIDVRYGQNRLKIMLDQGQLNRRIHQLLEAGINPVPIPVDWKRGLIVNPLRNFWNDMAKLAQEAQCRPVQKKLVKSTAPVSRPDEDEIVF